MIVKLESLRPYSTGICNRVFVKRLDPETKSRGGIIIPDTSQKPRAEGIVVAVGRGRWVDDQRRLEPAVKVGDRVLFEKYAGMKVDIDGVEHTVLIEQELDAVITEDAS